MKKKSLRILYPREYRIWKAMKARCYSPCFSDSFYQKNNIQVCEKWKNSFENFFNDMGKAPEGYSIDRIDNMGNYSPNNCRWADNHTQVRNRSLTRYYTYDGETMCLKDWAKKIGVKYTCLYNRILRGYSFEEAISPNFEQIIRLHRGFSSIHEGVSYNKSHNKWVAYYCKNSKQIHIGFYETENEAIKAQEDFVTKKKGE